MPRRMRESGEGPIPLRPCWLQQAPSLDTMPLVRWRNGTRVKMIRIYRMSPYCNWIYRFAIIISYPQACTHTHTHAHTRARAHAHTHVQLYFIPMHALTHTVFVDYIT